MTETVTFTRMDEGTCEDYQLLDRRFRAHAGGLADEVLAMLKRLGGDPIGYRVDRLQHSLQTASRAQRDGADEETVVAALLHDIGDTLGVYNHPDIAAAIVKPFVSEANHWMVEKHGIFQGYYFFHHLGLDRNVRDQFRGHPHFEHCAQFCHLFDQPAFDKDYKSMPLSEFEPMLRRVMAAPKQSIYLRKDGDAAW